MPRPHTLKIAEVFASFQGEGGRQGEPMIFVRLAGCNLECAFCDTKAARRGGRAASIEAIAGRVDRLRRRFPAGWVCLTGGDPMLEDIGPLISVLKRSGLRVQVETNGTVFRPVAADRLTVSPKPPSYDVRPELRGRASEAKLVVTRDLTATAVARVRRAFPPAVPLYLQPESNFAWSRAKADRLAWAAVRAGLGDVRLSVQLHKVYGLR